MYVCTVDGKLVSESLEHPSAPHFRRIVKDHYLRSMYKSTSSPSTQQLDNPLRTLTENPVEEIFEATISPVPTTPKGSAPPPLHQGSGQRTHEPTSSNLKRPMSAQPNNSSTTATAKPNIRPSSARRAHSHRERTIKPVSRPSSATYSYKGDHTGQHKMTQKKKPHSRPASAHARVGGGELRRPMSGNSMKTSTSSNVDLASSIAQKLGIADDEQPQRSKGGWLSTTKKVKMKNSKQGKSMSRFNMFKAKGTPIAPYDQTPKVKKADVVVLL